MGGRRKSNKIQKKEKPQTVRTIFDCALCGYKNCVIVKIKKVIKKAYLNCEKCGKDFSPNIKGLDEAIDVYHMWLTSLKDQKQTRHQPINRFDDMSENEGSAKDVEQIIKETKPDEDDHQSQFSADSLDNENKKDKLKDKQKEKGGKLLQKETSEIDSINEEEVEDDISEDSQLKEVTSISEIDSLISDDEILHKVRKLTKH